MPADLKELTTDIVATFVQSNSVVAADLPGLIKTVYGALGSLGEPEAPAPEPSTTASLAAIRKSIANPAYIVSFIDGKPYKTLKRHITTQGMTVSEYLDKYGLPKDYPTVSRESSLKRTRIALEMGLGRKKVPESVKAKAARKPRSPKAIDPADETFT